MNQPVSKERQSFLDASNERLKNSCLKRVDTTMIGALDIIEKEIYDLIGNLSENDGIMLREMYSKIRSKILDNGNAQKRTMTEEFKHYVVDWQMYQMVLPVKSRNNRGGNNV